MIDGEIPRILHQQVINPIEFGARIMLSRLLRIAILSPALLLLTCFPVQKPHRIDKTLLAQGKATESPTKAHLLDGSVILYDAGFQRRNDSILGHGILYGLKRNEGIVRNEWKGPLDSVVGLEYFDKEITGARIPGTVLVDATTTGVSALATGVLLKVVFGSCPTVYTSDGEQERLEAECFSYSIGSKYELPDLDRLEQRRPSAGPFTLHLKNEALETHYIDAFTLGYVDHPFGTEVFPTDDGTVLAASNLQSPVSARNSEGKDLTSLFRYRDNIAYAIDSATVRRMFSRSERDWIELAVPVPRDAEELTLALRGRNTLENTVLLYDVMMRDQGMGAVEWSESLSSSLWYAWQLYRWYTSMSGLNITVEHDGEFVDAGRVTDTGPIAWKTIATRIPLGEHGDTVRIRLNSLPDSWSIDWIGLDAGDHDQPELHYVACSSAEGATAQRGPTAIAAIAEDDGSYLVTYPGEWLDLSFNLPPTTGRQRTMFLYSKGYYIEWVRPEWVRERADVRGFDFSEPATLRTRLAELWSAKKDTFESHFFQRRIPTADPEKSW
jgi:hypothetical protein